MKRHIIPLVLIAVAFLIVYLASWYGGAKVDNYFETYDRAHATPITWEVSDA